MTEVFSFKKRVLTLQGLMRKKALPALVVSDPRDVFYYSGYQAGTDDHPLLLVPPEGLPQLFLSPLTGAVKARYAEVRLLKRKKDLLKTLPRTVGIDERHLPAKLFLELQKKSRVIPFGDAIQKPREVKDEQELELMRKAISIDRKVLEGIEIFNKKELDIAQGIEKGFFEQGASPAFETIVASGGNAGNYIHHFPGDRIVRKRDMVIIDFGSRWKGYSSDITRTYFLKTDRRQKGIFEAVLDIQQRCIDLVRPGADFGEINSFHKKLLQKKGFQPRHGIGHGIGIFVHEPASLLRKGMVVTIEPGIYLKNYGGCRIEDMVLVKEKPIVLSRSIPHP